MNNLELGAEIRDSILKSISAISHRQKSDDFSQVNSASEFAKPVYDLIENMTNTAWEKCRKCHGLMFWNFFVGKDNHVKILQRPIPDDSDIGVGQRRISLYAKDEVVVRRRMSGLRSLNNVLSLISKRLKVFYFDAPIVVSFVEGPDKSANSETSYWETDCRFLKIGKPSFLNDVNKTCGTVTPDTDLVSILDIVDQWARDESHNEEMLNLYKKFCGSIQGEQSEQIYKIAEEDKLLMVSVCKYLAWVFWSFPKMVTFVYVPASTGRSCSLPMGAAIGFSNCDANLVQILLQASMSVFFFVGQILDTFYGRLLDRECTRSAIGAIMSRNGSHNIGSHVLSALSHNVGTMPDDRVLYQYIQQRMDYIATVTTDFPNWSVPTHFVGDIMKLFFSQRHLLEHISESEGLHAYHFQGDCFADIANNQRGAIQIKVFGYKPHAGSRGNNIPFEQIVESHLDSCFDRIEFLKYESPDSVSVLLTNDVTIAIPGGVIGQHALYTILENFIRNVAKHSWTVEDKSNKNLVINVAFLDDPLCRYVQFLIWDELSNAETRVKIVDSADTVDLVEWLSKKLDERFVANGHARQENWGLAEMKISAGYLQKRSIGEIGGLEKIHYGGSFVGDHIIKPVSVGAKHHLGYRFSVPRPKDILIALKRDDICTFIKKKGTGGRDCCTEEEIQKCINSLNATPEFLSAGITFELVETVCKDIMNAYKGKGSQLLDYSFIVYPVEPPQETIWAAPYRFIVNKECKSDEYAKIDSCWITEVAELQARIASYGVNDTIVKIRSSLYSAWVGFLRDRFPWNGKKPQTINVLLNVNGDSGAEAGLITDIDVFVTMFKECYHSIVLDLAFGSQDSARQKRIGLIEVDEMYVLFILAQIGIEMDDVVKRIKGSGDRSVMYSIRRTKDSLSEILTGHFTDVRRNILNSILEVVEACRAIKREDYNGALGVVSGANSHAKMLVRRMIELKKVGRPDERALCEKVLDFIGGESNQSETYKKVSNAFSKIMGHGEPHLEPMTDFEQNLLKIISINRKKRTMPLCAELVDVFENAFLASDIFLRKYEERIITLPNGYRVGTSRHEAKKQVEIVLPDLTNPCTSKEIVARLIYNNNETHEDKHILYRRHDSERSDGAIYSEALSGSQSYLNALTQLGSDVAGNNDMKQLLQLVETGLLRVLIIDERADKFLRDHNEMAEIFAHLGIGVVDVLKSRTCDKYKGMSADDAHVIVAGNGNYENLNIPPKSGFDIIIIHQGVIDKWWPDKKHDANQVGNVLEKLQDVIPYVVVTTGRGRPDNIPKWAKVLPFASIESLLFRKYPEKMLLVNAIMSILPFSDDTEAN